MRFRSFLISILILGIATGVVVTRWHAQPPVTLAASNPGAAQTFNQLIVGFVDTGEFVEYWNDFTRNTCQRDEIFRLHDEMDATRTSLRAALYGSVVSAANSAVTGSETTVADPQTYIDLYREQTVELYYLRNFVKSHEVPLVGAPTSGRSVETDEGTLQIEMYTQFVEDKGWYGDDAFDALFTELVSNYEEKKEEFLNCGGWKNIASIDPEFQEIKERWQHLVDTFNAIKNLKKAFVEIVPPKASDPSSKNADKGNVGTFFREHFGMTLNGTCPKKGLSELWSNLKGTPYANQAGTSTDCKSAGDDESSASGSSDSDSESSSANTSLTELSFLAAASDEIYELTYKTTLLRSKYSARYGSGSDPALSDLIQLLEYADKGASLDTHIRNSIPEFKKWKKCAATVNNKFCS